MRTLVVVAILVPGIAAACFNRYAALLLYLWFALFRPQEWIWVDITSLRLSLFLGLLLVVPSILTGVLPNVKHPLSAGAILFVLAGILAQVNAVRPDIGWEWIDYMVRLVLVSLLAVSLINTRRRFVLALAVVAGSFGFYSAKAGVAFLLAGGVQFAYGTAGAFVDSVGYALGTVMVMPLLLASGQNMRSGWARWGFFAAVPLSGLTVIGTFSRAGFLGLVAIVPVFAFLQRRRSAAMTGLVLAMLLLLVLAPVPDRYFSRMQTIRTYDEIQDTSALGRLHFWRVAVNMVVDHPMGIGLHNYEHLYDAYDTSDGLYGHERAVHNSFFEVLAETGFAGALIWAFLFVTAVTRCLRIRRRARSAALSDADRRFLWTYANALIVSMVGFTVAGSFIALSLNDLTWLTFAFVAALDRLSVQLEAGTLAEESPASTSVSPLARHVREAQAGLA